MRQYQNIKGHEDVSTASTKTKWESDTRRTKMFVQLAIKCFMEVGCISVGGLMVCVRPVQMNEWPCCASRGRHDRWSCLGLSSKHAFFSFLPPSPSVSMVTTALRCLFAVGTAHLRHQTPAGLCRRWAQQIPQPPVPCREGPVESTVTRAQTTARIHLSIILLHTRRAYEAAIRACRAPAAGHLVMICLC